MKIIVSQDKKTIVNAETVERIYAQSKEIFAVTHLGATVSLGSYSTEENALQAMDYIFFGLSIQEDLCGVPAPSDENMTAAVKRDAAAFVEFLSKQEKCSSPELNATMFFRNMNNREKSKKKG